MDAPLCDGCLERDRLIGELRAELLTLRAEVRGLRTEIRELKARVGVNSSNSSLPPSANPPGAQKPVVKKPTGRKRGGQRGHRGHRRHRVPPEQVSEVIHHIPEVCASCQATLRREAGANDSAPTWHQFFELPCVVADVIEHQGHTRTCSCCGHVTRAAIPQEVLAHTFGPRLTALVSLLTGRCHLSKRMLAEVMETVFNVPMGVGTVSRLEKEMSAALAPAQAEAVAAVRQADVKYVDETSWKLAGRLHWLWTAARDKVAAFVIHERRGVEGLRVLLGDQPHGHLCSDRWSAYNIWPLGMRQVCWAHLQRDFQKLVDRGKPAAAIGEAALEIADLVFTAWHVYRDGSQSRRWMQREMEKWRGELRRVLQEGQRCRDRKAARFCGNLLALGSALWTFTRVKGLEPTNNHAERILRQGVLWRKCSFGCNSETGCRFVERILSVVETLRLQGRKVIDYLERALTAHRKNQMAPSLLAGP